MTTLTILLSILFILFLVLFLIYYIKNNKSEISYKDANDKYIKVKTRNDQLLTMFMSDRALHIANLTTNNNLSFKAYYDVEILELTKKMAKVSAISVIADNSEMNTKKSYLISYMQDRWIPLDEIQMIINDDAIKRELRLSKLLDDKS